jgi:hypothetical protein
MTGFSEEWGPEGVLRCYVCKHETKCHLWAWGSTESKGHCNNCGTQGRTTQWVPKDWGPPPHNVLEPEFGKPRVN